MNKKTLTVLIAAIALIALGMGLFRQAPPSSVNVGAVASSTILIITVPFKEVSKQSPMGDYTEIAPDFGKATVGSWGQVKRYSDKITIWVEADAAAKTEFLKSATVLGKIETTRKDSDLIKKIKQVTGQ